MAWPHQLEYDNREPILTFQFQDRLLAIYFVSIPFWIEALVLMVLHACFAAVIGLAIYSLIIRQRGTPLAFLVGFGIMVPFWTLAPGPTLDALGITNKVFRFCYAVITPTTSIFRVIEAMYGFAPEHATKSASSYALYYGSPMLLVYDLKTATFVKATSNVIVGHLFKFVLYLFLTGIYQSLFTLLPHNFPPLGTTHAERMDEWYNIDSIFNVNRLRESVLYGILLQCYLATFGEGLIFFTSFVTGIETYEIMRNPIFKSKSPSEFWGRRWNLLIHNCLKNGVYKPVRSIGGSRATAVFAAFVASGLFHENLLPIVFFDYKNVKGATTVFFLWQASLMVLEVLLSSMVTFTTLNKMVPGPIKTVLVILLGIPLGHWFYDSYVHSNFFQQGHVGLIAILPIKA